VATASFRVGGNPCLVLRATDTLCMLHCTTQLKIALVVIYISIVQSNRGKNNFLFSPDISSDVNSDVYQVRNCQLL